MSYILYDGRNDPVYKNGFIVCNDHIIRIGKRRLNIELYKNIHIFESIIVISCITDNRCWNIVTLDKKNNITTSIMNYNGQTTVVFRQTVYQFFCNAFHNRWIKASVTDSTEKYVTKMPPFDLSRNLMLSLMRCCPEVDDFSSADFGTDLLDRVNNCGMKYTKNYADIMICINND